MSAIPLNFTVGTNVVIGQCQHARKVLAVSPTTNYPPPAIWCADCNQTLAAIEEARRFVAAYDDRQKPILKAREPDEFDAYHEAARRRTEQGQ